MLVQGKPVTFPFFRAVCPFLGLAVSLFYIALILCCIVSKSKLLNSQLSVNSKGHRGTLLRL